MYDESIIRSSRIRKIDPEFRPRNCSTDSLHTSSILHIFLPKTITGYNGYSAQKRRNKLNTNRYLFWFRQYCGASHDYDKSLEKRSRCCPTIIGKYKILNVSRCSSKNISVLQVGAYKHTKHFFLRKR